MNDFLIRLAAKDDSDKVLSLMRACSGQRECFCRAWYEWFNFRCAAGFIDKGLQEVKGRKAVEMVWLQEHNP